MEDYFFNTREDYHYDGSGYYGYLLINGDEQKRDRLLQALGKGPQENGLGWHRYGKSFRPANNGRTYDWYIRLHHGGPEKPSAQEVDDLLREHLQPPQPAPEPPPPPPPEPAPQWPEREQLTRHLERLQADVAQEKAAHQEILGAQQGMAALLDKLRSIDTRFSDDLEHLRRDLQDIAATWRVDQWSDLNLGAVIHTLDDLNARLTQDLTRLQQDYRDLTSAHADTLRAQGELAQVLERIKDHDRHISEDLTRLQQDVQRLAARDGQAGADDGQRALLQRFDALGSHVAERIDALETAVQAGTAARDELEARQQQVAALQGELDDAQRERDEAQEAIQGLRRQLTESRPDRSGLLEQEKTMGGLIRRQKKDIRALKDQVKQLKNEGRELAQDRDNWKQQFTDVSQEYSKLQTATASGALPAPATADRGSADDTLDLEQVMGLLLPGTELINNSWDYLKFEIRQREPFLRKIGAIMREPRVQNCWAVRGADDWMELHVGKQWRIYFCRKLNRRRAAVMISRKAEQDADMRWMRRNPAASVLENGS